MMKVYKELVRVFLRSGEMDNPKQKKQKLCYTLLGLLSIFGVMLPCCVLVGYIAYAFTLGLSGAGDGCLLMIHFIALFSVVFGIHVILNVFYFAGDISFILPLPISSEKLITAKFTAAYFNETVMQTLVLISGFAGFFLASQKAWWCYLLAIAGVVTLPLAPLLYCGICCVLIMAFTKVIRNKEHARKLVMAVVAMVMIGMIFSVGLLQEINLEHFMEQLAQGKITFVHVMNTIFPTNYLFMKAIAEQKMGCFFLYMLINILLFVTFLVVAKLFYNKGLLAMAGTGAGAKKQLFKSLKEKQHSPWFAYLKKEWQILYRTPAFFTNCLLIHLLWPVLFYIIYIMQKQNQLWEQFQIAYLLENEGIQWLTTLLLIVLTVLVTAANSIASTGITREGKQYTFMKQIPISYQTQLQVKALLSIGISGVVVAVYIMAAAYVLAMEPLQTVFYIVTALLEVVFITYFGLYLDTINPKLFWDDELNALRGNSNVFFNMAYAMMLAGGFVVLMFLFYYFTAIPLRIMEILLLLLFILADMIMYRICMTKGVRNLERL